MRKIISSLICLLLPACVLAADPQIRPDAPDRHVVAPGDSLWSIANLFFKDPWKWPHLWGKNRDNVKNPHWIYPGMVITLDRVKGEMGVTAPADTLPVVKLKPQVRVMEGGQNDVASIPSKVIAPFLTQPLAVDEGELANAPTVVALQEGRVILGEQGLGYASGLPPRASGKWRAYLPGRSLTDPDTEEVLGHEVVYLGDVEVVKPGELATVKVVRNRQEIGVGTRLMTLDATLVGSYLPRAPAEHISGKVISLYGNMQQAAQNHVVTLNRGRRDGLEEGHVLALYKAGQKVKYQGQVPVQLPEERNGLLFVFRVFEKVSYALVMETRLPVTVLDRVETP